jgi:PAS domain S-box-containing protein
MRAKLPWALTAGEFVGLKPFLALLEGTADAAFAIDATGRISGWNKAAVELFGITEAEAIGRSCHKVLQCSDDNGMVCAEQCVIERAARVNRPPVNFDLRLQTRTGKIWCNVSTLIASDQASGALNAIHLVRPVETRKRLEQALSEFIRTRSANDLSSAPVNLAPPRIKIPLTSREVEVLKSLAKGHGTKAIANQLNISTATVNNHIKHILAKFDAHSRLEVIRHAESIGVI